MSSRHNQKGSLSPHEIKKREEYCDKLTKTYLHRQKFAGLKNLLADSSAQNVSTIPSDEELKFKFIQKRLETLHTKKPEALESLRSFRIRLDGRNQNNAHHITEVTATADNTFLKPLVSLPTVESTDNPMESIEMFDDVMYLPRTSRASQQKQIEKR